MGPLEGHRDIVGAELREPVRRLRSVGRAVSDGFVHHIPIHQLAVEMAHDGGDVFLQDGRGLGAGIVSGSEPGRKILLPHQVVPANLHAVGLRVGDDLIAPAKVELVRGGLSFGELHVVFRDHQIELAADSLRIAGVGKVVGIHCAAHEEAR